jgi:RNA polymerase primary sigma factor
LKSLEAAELDGTDHGPADDAQGRTVVQASTRVVSVDPVQVYLARIRTVPLLTAGQEVDLARRIEAGALAAAMLACPQTIDPARVLELARRSRLSPGSCEGGPADPAVLCGLLVADGDRARDQLVEANLRLVVSIAKRYVGSGLLLLDLIQEGNLGLMRAAGKFDYERGFKFSTYAVWWIRQGVTRAIADQARTIRLPVHVVEHVNRLITVQRDLVQRLGRDPSVEEIAVEAQLCPERVSELLTLAQSPVSLASPMGHDDGFELADVIGDPSAVAPDQAAASVLLREEISSLLETMNERERRIIELRFGLLDDTPRTLEDVGMQLGVTRERIRQIEARVLAKLRHPSLSGRLSEFFR